ncbi:HPr family phosphocarrier protein [Tepidibacillus marianensis]|uniref:HPr family phosphocarrier protein n=1 Tax=Tepidibacillus marianensis TaxID=3131995 RepID=UPI0030D33829
MIERQVTITNELGLHARPVSILIKEATKFKSDVKIVMGDKEVNAKSIMGVLALGAVKGQQLGLKVSGPDEENAINSLVTLFEQNFGE